MFRIFDPDPKLILKMSGENYVKFTECATGVSAAVEYKYSAICLVNNRKVEPFVSESAPAKVARNFPQTVSMNE